MSQGFDVRLDERGQRCPMPVLSLARCCAQHPPGTVIALIADDPAAKHDIPAWCRMKGAELIEVRQPDDGESGVAYLVRIRPSASD